MRSLPILLALAFLAACAGTAPPAPPELVAALPAPVPAAAPAAPAADEALDPLARFTQADLRAATADAEAHGDKVAAMCWAYLGGKVGTAGSAGPPVGAASTFQRVRDLRRGVQDTSAGDALNLACAPLVTETRLVILRLAAIGGAAVISPIKLPLPILP